MSSCNSEPLKNWPNLLMNRATKISTYAKSRKIFTTFMIKELYAGYLMKQLFLNMEIVFVVYTVSCMF